MAISSARQFYEMAVSGGAPFLESLVTNRVPETEWLDFKGSRDLGDEQVKAKWSEAVCGFANNQGGVLVWGIDARPDKTTAVDAACEIQQVPDPDRLRSRLTRLHPDTTDPPLVGVECIAVYASGSSGPGFVVCYVPESDNKPHRAFLLDNKPYMLRIGHGFYNPSPSILRNLFFPGSSPRVGVVVTPQWNPVDRQITVQDIEIRFEMSLKNTGVVTARDVFVVFSNESGLPIETPYSVEKADVVNATGIDVRKPVHPMSHVYLGTVRMRVPRGTRTSTGDSVWVPCPSEFKAYFRIFAADMVPVTLLAHLGDRDIDLHTEKHAWPIEKFPEE